AEVETEPCIQRPDNFGPVEQELVLRRQHARLAEDSDVLQLRLCSECQYGGDHAAAVGDPARGVLVQRTLGASVADLVERNADSGVWPQAAPLDRDPIERCAGE